MAISKSIYNDLLENIPNSLVKLVYNPVNFEKCFIEDKSINEYELKHQYNALYVGRISQEKRIDIIIQAIAKTTNNWHLMIVGDDNSSYGKDMKILSNKLNISDRIHWKGWQENPWISIDKADVMVVASEYEGFSLAAIEAMLNGIPVISTEVGVMPEIIEQGVNGFLFPYGNVDALTDILNQMSKSTMNTINPDLCREKVLCFEKTEALENFNTNLLELINSININDNEEI